jgi:2,4-dichlorophenol 6-monooxygenase
VISIGDSITDPDGAWAEVSELVAGGAVLVRPDNHVGWRSAAASSATADDLLDEVARLLHR